MYSADPNDWAVRVKRIWYFIICKKSYVIKPNQIKPQLFFKKDGFGIKYPMKVNMPLNKETKAVIQYIYIYIYIYICKHILIEYVL